MTIGEYEQRERERRLVEQSHIITELNFITRNIKIIEIFLAGKIFTIGNGVTKCNQANEPSLT